MLKNKISIYTELRILIFVSLFSVVNLFAYDSQYYIDELNSSMPEIPLKNALGNEEYNRTIGSGEYRYVGSSKCRLCHRKFFIGRKKDLHDSSMESLVKTGYEKNSHCLTCHSTGHRIDTGFVSIETTPRLSNVQCEGCHGPGNIHIKLAKDKKSNSTQKFVSGGFLTGQDSPKELRKMCTSCHTKRWEKSYHDLNKAYNSYKKADPNSRYK